ncbi:hypothetical protein MIND_01269500 [Mycena indigotica]|uniref:DUF6535 domain-containing protein n=1 Tax=Mycena indigotica TaxID=2126181 RepID=A0A8H6VRE5_9AGAR|nr:uncharacterized protein MIND_01269500 [Mycena indigotica]KAF7291257.1 hypothetical protein MIND_01269500 [Mycena indigotica]
MAQPEAASTLAPPPTISVQRPPTPDMESQPGTTTANGAAAHRNPSGRLRQLHAGLWNRILIWLKVRDAADPLLRPGARPQTEEKALRLPVGPSVASLVGATANLAFQSLAIDDSEGSRPHRPDQAHWNELLPPLDAGAAVSSLVGTTASLAYLAVGLPDADNSPFRRSCREHAQIWKLYMDIAQNFDKSLAETFNSDLDSLLIFAGLFSAILSAFLIEVRRGLEEDLQSVTNTLLKNLIQVQANASSIIPPTEPFSPTPSTRFVNALWFTSLTFSLLSALGASAAKSWVTQLAKLSGSSWSNASAHCRRLRGIQRWHFAAFVQSLPFFLHVAFFLFGAGLVIILFQDDKSIGILTLALTSIVAILYVGNIVFSAIYPDSPYRTPLSGLLQRYVLGLKPRTIKLLASPEEDDARKAQALAWLLAQPVPLETTQATIRAIAGLPFSKSVQHELYHGTTTAMLSTQLIDEIADVPAGTKPSSDSLQHLLYALLHLVQTAPEEAPASSAARDALKRLVIGVGPLVHIAWLPLQVQAPAMCLKAAIIYFLSGKELVKQNAQLFSVQIPYMARTCSEKCLRYLFTRLAYSNWSLEQRTIPKWMQELGKPKLERQAEQILKWLTLEGKTAFSQKLLQYLPQLLHSPNDTIQLSVLQLLQASNIRDLNDTQTKELSSILFNVLTHSHSSSVQQAIVKLLITDATFSTDVPLPDLLQSLLQLVQTTVFESAALALECIIKFSDIHDEFFNLVCTTENARIIVLAGIYHSNREQVTEIIQKLLERGGICRLLLGTELEKQLISLLDVDQPDENANPAVSLNDKRRLAVSCISSVYTYGMRWSTINKDSLSYFFKTARTVDSEIEELIIAALKTFNDTNVQQDLLSIAYNEVYTCLGSGYYLQHAVKIIRHLLSDQFLVQISTATIEDNTAKIIQNHGNSGVDVIVAIFDSEQSTLYRLCGKSVIVEILIKQLEDISWSTRRDAVQFIHQIFKHAQSIEDLANLLPLSTLTGLLIDGDEDVRYAVIQCLNFTEEKGIYSHKPILDVQQIKAIIADTDSSVCQSAMTFFVRVMKREVPEYTDQEATDIFSHIITLANDSSRGGVQMHAIRTVIDLWALDGDVGELRTIVGVKDYLNDSSWRVRMGAVACMGAILQQEKDNTQIAMFETIQNLAISIEDSDNDVRKTIIKTVVDLLLIGIHLSYL